MKTFIIVFDKNINMENKYSVGIIMKLHPTNTTYFEGYWAPTLKEAYYDYVHKKPRTASGLVHCGFKYMTEYYTDMYYEISERQLKKLIKIEELTGAL